jgi:hypothetical protein
LINILVIQNWKDWFTGRNLLPEIANENISLIEEQNYVGVQLAMNRTLRVVRDLASEGQFHQ